ncbi:MAG: glucose-1-phosphate adenylyltransferase subunit GlgD, partial [Erysipelotrichaceae bacterium]|nr:glucose-1-phosphate adenylyltransferase subunit GlgD [Erysipelotrichaceae bacterium]
STVLAKHLETGADVTVLYTSTGEAKTSYLGCDVLTLDKTKKVTAIDRNRGNTARKNVSMECYVMTKKLFIDLVKKAAETSSLYWFKDILRDSVGELDIRGFQFKGYVACINSLPEYFRVSMALRDRTTAAGLFKPGWPIYTQTNDSSPTKYEAGSKVTGSVVANGSVIEGTAENCIISRGVTIRKGAVIKNSIILPGAYIGEKVKLDHVVVDKYAIIHHVKELVGTDDAPIYVKRRDRI